MDDKDKKEKSFGTMNIILIIVGMSLLVFTVIMIWLFYTVGDIPDTLCTCVFAALGGECSVMGWIKTNKDKLRDREWQKEDQASGASSFVVKTTEENNGELG